MKSSQSSIKQNKQKAANRYIKQFQLIKRVDDFPFLIFLHPTDNRKQESQV